jgi:hypothetical protein
MHQPDALARAQLSRREPAQAPFTALQIDHHWQRQPVQIEKRAQPFNPPNDFPDAQVGTVQAELGRPGRDHSLPNGFVGTGRAQGSDDVIGH